MPEELNLSAAEAFGRRRSARNDGNPPPLTAENTHFTPELALLEAVQKQNRRLRTGLALVLTVVFPGLGLLFLGSYIWAVVYAVVYVGCIFKAVSMVLLAGESTFWWLLGALVVWVVSLIHTSTAVEDE